MFEFIYKIDQLTPVKRKEEVGNFLGGAMGSGFIFSGFQFFQDVIEEAEIHAEEGGNIIGCAKIENLLSWIDQ
ncbi:MAG TPA: hypothetical protein ENH40_06235 [Nitrospirae bacterium]|nr:hypothetical protein [Nitrospirota bacterium]